MRLRRLVVVSTAALLAALVPSIEASAATTATLTLKQSGTSVTATWKYKGGAPASQKMVVTPLTTTGSSTDAGTGSTGGTTSLTDLMTDEVRTITLKRTSKSVKVNDLVPGTSYSFTLTGTKPSVKITKNLTVVAKPTAPTSLSLNWSKQDVLGMWVYDGPTVKEWLVSYTGADGKTKNVRSTSLLNTFKLTGLSKNESYSVSLRGSNAGGLGPKVSGTLAPVAPGTPASVNVQSLDGNGDVATVSWTYEGPTVTGFKIAVKAAGSLRDGDTVDASSAARTVNIDKLSLNATYTFTVTATNSFGSATATSQPFVTLKPIPAPTGLTATGANGAIALKWTAPTADATNPIIGYKIEVSSDNGATWRSIENKSTATTYNVATLTNGESYTFRVSAFSVKGAGKPSATVAALAGVAPGAPTSVKLTPGQKSLTVTWVAPTGATSPVTGYKVEYKKATDTNYTALADTTQLTATISNLDSVNYNVRVSAISANGAGVASAVVSAIPTDVPAAPVLTAPTNATNGSIALTWTLSSDGGSKITTYKIEQQIGDGAWTALNGTTAVTTTTYTASGLQGGTTYKYRVSGTNAIGTGALSNVVTVTVTSTPGTPVVTATPSNAQVVLTWTEPANGGTAITAYKVERAAVGSSTWAVLTDALTAVTYTVSTGLANGTAYQFRVTAKNANGWGTVSAAVNATPATTPAALTGIITEPNVTEVRVKWSAPGATVTATGGSAITGFIVSYRTVNGAWVASSPIAPNLTQYDVLDLAAATAYEFKVAAVNAIGTGSDSTIKAATTVAAPLAPTDLGGVGKDAAVDLTWKSPLEPITAATGGTYKYTIEYSADGSTWSLATKDTTATTLTVNSLRNGTQYTFRIAAGYTINGKITYGATAEIKATPRGTPGAPEGFTASQLSASSVRLVWTAPTNNGGGFIEGYEVSFTANGTTWSDPVLSTSNTTIDVTGLTGGLTYTFRVLTKNTFTKSGYVTTEFTPLPAPASVTGLATGTIGSGSVALGWNPSPTIEKVTGYKVEYSADGNNFSVATASTASTSYTVTGLTNGTTYTFRVSAINVAGTSSGVTVTGKPVGPAPVTGMSASAGDEKVTLSWASPVDGGATVSGIRIRYTSNGGTSWTVAQASLTPGTTSSEVGNLVNGTPYTFEVVVLTNLGDSVAATASATPVPPVPSAPQSFTVSSTTTNTASLSWSAPALGGTVTYQVDYMPAGGSWSTATTGLAGTTYTVTGLTANTSYDFKVYAVNGTGTGPAATASGTTLQVP